jgi:hypothetical protein
MGRAALVVVMVLFGTAAAAAPDTAVGVPPSLTALLTRPDHLAALQRAARAADPPGGATCPDADYVTTGDIGIVQPLKTGDKGELVSGAFKESVQETGCGMDRRLNALTTIGPDGTAETTPLLPGSTIADPELQRDSVPFAAGAMGPLPPDCDGGSVIDTHYVGLDGMPPGTRPKPGQPPRPWTEVWTLQACAKHVDVTMHFAPDATGTDIRADPVK